LPQNEFSHLNKKADSNQATGRTTEECVSDLIWDQCLLAVNNSFADWTLSAVSLGAQIFAMW
jgi:hypothetical protein